MSDEQYSDIQYAIYAMERCARGLRAMGARVEAANPDDPYSAVHYHDDAESVEKGVAALKRITAEQPQGDAVAWIACSERMPDDGVEVLVWSDDANEAWVTYRRPWIDCNGKKARSYWDSDDNIPAPPTHWMPLPAAPGSPPPPAAAPAEQPQPVDPDGDESRAAFRAAEAEGRIHSISTPWQVWRECVRSFAPAEQPQHEPVIVEAVAQVVVRNGEPRLDWLVEGGLDSLPDGVRLMVSLVPLTGDDGSGEVYLAPPPPPPAAAPIEAQDAARYRWLRAEHERVDPLCHVVWKRSGDRNGSDWVNTANLDAAIDAALAAAREGR